VPGSIGMASSMSAMETGFEPRIEDGKLRYEKRFYHRGQPVFVTEKDSPRFAANIHNIGLDAVSTQLKHKPVLCRIFTELSQFFLWDHAYLNGGSPIHFIFPFLLLY